MKKKDLLERLGDKMLIGDGCWEWTAHRHRGYGYLGDRRAHRVVYELMVGPIPDGLVIDHLCRNTACVRPSHLEAVTQTVNIRRGVNPNRTHCLHGHPLDGVHRKGNRYCRYCRTCKGAYQRKHRAEKRQREQATP